MLRNLLTVYMILSIVFDLSVANDLGLKKGTSAPYFKHSLDKRLDFVQMGSS